MASVAYSNIVELTRRVGGNKGTALSLAGQPVAAFRITAGQISGDTAVLSSAQIPIIQSVFGPVTHNITAASGATAVTVTLGTFSTAVTSTIGTVDVWLVGPVPTS